VRVRIEEFRDTKPKKQTSKRPACLQSHAALDQETRICGLDSSALNRAARNFQLPSLALCHFCHHAVRPKGSRVGAVPFDVSVAVHQPAKREVPVTRGALELSATTTNSNDPYC
jgi:hypothetical protein